MNQTLPAHLPTIALMDPATFDQMQRVGGMLAVSPLFPEHLRKGDKAAAIANGVLVMNMAMRLQEDPLTVAQNIYFVGGKPGWSASYMIGKANQHGVFRDPIDWEVKGTGDNLSVTAFAVLTKTGKRVAVTCDMKMARAEGWTKNVKYMSMPEQMLRYRSATFLIRLYCPEVMIGVPAAIENELAMKDVTPDDGAYLAQARTSTPHDAETGEVLEAEAKPAAAAEMAKPAAKAAPVEDAKPAAPVKDEAPKEEDAPPYDVLKAQCNTVCADMADSRMPESVFDFYAERIAVIRKHAPDLAKVIDETAAKITAEENAQEAGGAPQGDLLNR